MMDIHTPARTHTCETAFLRQCLRYEDSAECRRLEAGLAVAHRDERCVRSAVWLTIVLTALALTGLGYAAVLLADFPENKSRLPVKFLGGLGLASVISLLTFTAIWVMQRQKLDQRRQECRRWAERLLRAQVGEPSVKSAAGATLDPNAVGIEWRLQPTV